ncbi:hypothetical protein [Streptomyces sp. NPDC058254]|uniref:hypothetical protein n=1 Tax=Streptomyces sp. NPDC058254 TaxID=3346406 RepID=UPI0036F04E8F
MSFFKRSSEQHHDAHLMGKKVQHDGETYTVVGLQSRWATVSRPDGFQRNVAISDIEDQ